MESKEIYAVILAALGIVLVIGILSMITKSVNPEQQESIPVATDAGDHA